MKLLNIDFYTIQISHNTFLNITYNNNFGIIYRNFKNNHWSSYSTLTKNCTKSFCVLPLPNKEIGVIYQSNTGNIVFSKFSNNKWSYNEILKWKGSKLKDLEIKAIYNSNKIHIFYCMNLSSSENNNTLFYQNIDLNLKISKPCIVDSNIVKISNSFCITPLDNNHIIASYQQLSNKYTLGYKILNCNSYCWSDYYIMDKSISPYTDFTLCCSKNIIHALYVKNNSSKNILIHASGYLSDFNYINVFESINTIKMPCIFKFDNTVWDIWINDTSIYCCYSTDNGINLSDLEQENLPKTLIKTCYLSFNENFNNNTNFMYINFNNNLTFYPHWLYDTIENLFNIDDNPINEHGKNFNIKKYMFNMQNKLNYYEKKIAKKNQTITQLNYMLKEEKHSSLLSNNKLKELESNYTNLEDKYKLAITNCTKTLTKYKDTIKEKNLLNKKVEQIDELTKLLDKKEKTILQLKDSINSDYESYINDLKSKIENYKLQITTLISNINNLKQQINNKSTSSILKKFFSNE